MNELTCGECNQCQVQENHTCDGGCKIVVIPCPKCGDGKDCDISQCSCLSERYPEAA